MKKKFSDDEKVPEASAMDEDAVESDDDGKTRDEEAEGDAEGKLA